MLNKQEAEKMKEELFKNPYSPPGDGMPYLNFFEIEQIIDQFTEPEPDEPFEIPVMQVWLNDHGRPQFRSDVCSWPWWHAIFANAASIKDCKWVTCQNDEQVIYWKKKPFRKENYWYSNFDEAIIKSHYIHPSLIPADCSRAIVRIEHV